MSPKTLTVVTGGTRGIGLATAKAFAQQGSRVVILGRDQDRIRRVLADDLRAQPASDYGNTNNNNNNNNNNSNVATSVSQGASEESFHQGFQCDVADPREVEAVFKKVSQLGPIDFLINSAGIAKDSLLMSHSEKDIESVLQTNLMGTIWVNKAVAKGMMRRKQGSIVNISSVVGIQGNMGQTAYSASKAAVIGFSKSLAKELGSRGVRVNVLAPGYITTDMTEGIADDKKRDIIARTSLGRLGTPEEVAEAALFLATAKFITGQVLVVDGGLQL
ncbi:reductase [Actinomortierella ambigua]|uniref:Reductase n=1 Tax=Actinomortierella ambigua TaxID=1343610 RepID=A0A9P6QJT8_9FUNG|nr:reductase [Actinomortierella ambigua]